MDSKVTIGRLSQPLRLTRGYAQKKRSHKKRGIVRYAFLEGASGFKPDAGFKTDALQSQSKFGLPHVHLPFSF